MKPDFKVYLEPELASQINDATAQFRAAGRKVSRNEVIVQLIEDGFRWWRREAQVVNRVETSIGQLLDQSAKHDRLLRSILLTLAEDDPIAIQNIEKEFAHHEA